MWDGALAISARVFATCAERGINLAMVNLGGGFPAKYVKKGPAIRLYGDTIFRSLKKHFGNALPETDDRARARHRRQRRHHRGRGRARSREVRRSDALRWVYLDIGKFGGLAETPTRRSVSHPHRARRRPQGRLACSPGRPATSLDVLYEKEPYLLPISLEVGDKVLIEGTGAYTTTYSSVGFNGFAPLKQYVI